MNTTTEDSDHSAKGLPMTDIHAINVAWDALVATAPERARAALSAAVSDERWSRRALGSGSYCVSTWTAARFAVLRDVIAMTRPRVDMRSPLARRLSRDIADTAASIPPSARTAIRRMTYSSLAWGRS